MMKYLFLLSFVFLGMGAGAAEKECAIYQFQCLPSLDIAEIRKLGTASCGDKEKMAQKGLFSFYSMEDAGHTHSCTLGKHELDIEVKPSLPFEREGDQSCLGKIPTISVELKNNNSSFGFPLEINCVEPSAEMVLWRARDLGEDLSYETYSKKKQESFILVSGHKFCSQGVCK